MSKIAAAVLLAALAAAAFAARGPSGAETPPAPEPAKVYGEWLIRVRPDKGAEYAQLIREKGLPLFREAGGRMVGWWTTLVGDLYEHVTIWEYDGMAGFEKAVQFLGKDGRFTKFTKLRDPLLSGEQSRFLKLAAAGERPPLEERARVVVHEVHRVPLGRWRDYWQEVGAMLTLCGKHEIRLAGPFYAIAGRSSDVTYLWLHDSLAEREAKLIALTESGDGERIDRFLSRNVDEVTTRVLLPAPFAR